MDITRYFLLPDGRLRGGWRFLLFLGLYSAASRLLTNEWPLGFIAFYSAIPLQLLGLIGGIHSSDFESWMYTFQGLAVVCPITWLMMRFLDRRSFFTVGLGWESESRKQMVLGLAGGAGMVGTIALIEWATGMIHFSLSTVFLSWVRDSSVHDLLVGKAETGPSAIPGHPPLLSLVGWLLGAIIVYALSALYQELLFRGYPFQRLVEASNGIVAVALFSLAFAWWHRNNPFATNLSLFNTVLASVLFSLAYLKTRALWLPISFHFSWNLTLELLSLPVSGGSIGLGDMMPWNALPSDQAEWLYGGFYGPEGGLVATVVLGAAIGYLIKMRSRSAGPMVETVPESKQNGTITASEPRTPQA